MFSRRVLMAMLSAMLVLAATAGSAAAAKPIRPNPGERPLTPEEQAASDRKIAEAERYLEEIEAQGGDLVSLSCVTPTGTGTDLTVQACDQPQGFLAVEARDQTKGHYCGPAVGQVIANYSWAVKTGANKYTQAKIAGWMRTDLNGLTNAPELEDGLELGTARSPRRPANWDWVVSPLSDLDRDGTTADQLHGYVRSNVSNSRMPLAISVKPHAKTSQYHLVSWPKPVASPGHWIAAYGWVGLWTGNDSARLYFTDSSRDEGGSTGKFWDPFRHVAAMIMEHTRRFVW